MSKVGAWKPLSNLSLFSSHFQNVTWFSMSLPPKKVHPGITTLDQLLTCCTCVTPKSLALLHSDALTPNTLATLRFQSCHSQVQKSSLKRVQGQARLPREFKSNLGYIITCFFLIWRRKNIKYFDQLPSDSNSLCLTNSG